MDLQKSESKPKNPYAVLNLSPTCTEDEIQHSYKELSLAFHPDKQRQRRTNDDSGGEMLTGEQARQVFIEFKKSYDILIDPALRLAYDLHGHDGVAYLQRSKAQQQVQRNEPTMYQKVSFLTEEAQAVDEDVNGKKGGGINFANRSIQKAIDILNEAMQYYYFTKPPSSSPATTHTALAPPEVSSDLVMEYSALNSNLLGEGVEPTGSLDLETAKINFSVKTPIPVKLSCTPNIENGNNTSKDESETSKSKEKEITLTFGGGGMVNQKGQGQSNASIGLSFEQNNGSDVNLDLEVIGADGEYTENGESSLSLPNKSKITIGSSRVMSNGNYFSWNVSTIPMSSQLAYSIATHRSLFQNKLVGTWAMGMGSDFSLHYGLLSFTTRDENKPKVTTKFNIGLGSSPVRCIVDKDFSNTHSGQLSCGWALRQEEGGVFVSSMDIQVYLKRKITKYCSLYSGLQHSPFQGGLKFLLRLDRGSCSFKIPIMVTSGHSPGYSFKVIYMASIMSLIDELIGMYNADMSDSTDGSISVTTQKNQTRVLQTQREERLLEREKIKRDALKQIELMAKPAMTKRKAEEREKGLVILKATYAVDAGDSVDVTIALQFWVSHSTLHLPPTTKSSMLGFYDVTNGNNQANGNTIVNGERNVFSKIMGLWQSFGKNKNEQTNEEQAVPTLTVRYRYSDDVYEITIMDNEELHLPSKNAMKLGNVFVE